MKHKHILIGLALIIAAIIFLQPYDYFEVPEKGEIITSTTGHGSSEEDYNPLSLASSVSCTPSTGYDICYSNTYNGLTAKIESTNWQGKRGYGYINGANRNYYIDEVYVNVKSTNDKLYTSNSNSWITCGENGCSATQISSGKQVLATAPASSIPSKQFAAWEKFTGTSGRWIYSYVTFGWINGPYNYYVLDCYDDSDVDVGYFCDKSGAWNTWTAKKDMCVGVTTPNTCDGFNLYSQTCNKLDGQPIKGTLIEANSTTCGCYYATDIPNTCTGFDLYSQKQKTMCIDSGYSIDTLIESNSATCGYICTTGETQTVECTDKTNVISATCDNNRWIQSDYPIQSCPLNWINLKSILTSYYDKFMDWIT